MAIVNANCLIAGFGGTTNYCPNPWHVGIVPGTPGTLPTAHTPVGALSGLTQQVVGIGVDVVTGLPYYDVRFFGLSTSTFIVYALNNGASYATLVGGGVNYIFSCWLAVVGGSAANLIGGGPLLSQRYNGGTPSIVNGPYLTPTPALTQYTLAGTSGNNTSSIYPCVNLSFNIGVAVDITLRIGPNQFELGTVPSPQIWPPAGTVAWSTRALLAAPDVRGPAGIQYANCTIYGTGGVAVPATGLTWIATTRATIPGAGGTTNYAPNPLLGGAVIGAPGTLSTGTATAALGGLTQIVLGTGTDVVTGMPYVDVRFYGVCTQGYLLYYVNTAPWHLLPCAPGTNWIYSQWVALVGGSLTNTTNIYQQLRFNGGIPAVSTPTTFAPTSTLTQFVHAATTTAGGMTTSIQASSIFYTSTTLPVDFTLRFGPAQLEIGQARTPQIWNPVGVPGWTTRALLAMPDVLGPPGVQYASAQINGAGGFAFNPVNSRFLASALIAGTGGQTNWIRNPLSEGLIAGTPGTIPTFWQAWSTNGLNRDLSLQIINGEPFTVTRWYGNTNVAGGITAYVENQGVLPLMPLVNGQTVTFSVDLAIIAGSHPGPLFFTIGGTAATSTFVAIGTGFQNDITAPLIATTTPRRYSVTYTANDPTTAYVRFNILPIRGATLGQAIDVTLAIGYPQAEYGPVPTGVILPPPGAPGFATRPLLAAPVQRLSAACEIDGAGAIATAEQVGLVAANLSTETGMVWDPASILDPVNTTLSSDNRTVLHTDPTTSNFDGVRGILPPLGAGKYYAEFTPPGGATSWTASCSIGVCNINANYHSLYDTAANGCVFQPLYGIWVNGVDTGLLHNAWLNNETAAMAADLDNERIWFRVLPSGLWNGTPGADPTIPSTGIDLSSIPLLQFDAFAEVNLANRSIEINAGSEPFRGAVPAGFISWPTPGHVQATPQLVAQGAAEFDAVSNLRATAVVRVPAGAVIAGGEGNRLPYITPGPQAPHTVVVSTDIAPPLPGGSLVFKHTALNAIGGTNIGALSVTAATPLVPYTVTVSLWIPSGWGGTSLYVAAEGGGFLGLFLNANLTLFNQWQLVSFQTPAPTGQFSVVLRATDATASPVYTSLWQAVPDTITGGAVSRETSVSRIAGTGGVFANAAVLRPAYAQIPGGGVTNYIRNPRAEGAIPGVLGSGGALPTFWGALGDASGLTKTVVGSGTDPTTGLTYVDFRFSGTTTAGQVFAVYGFDTSTQHYTGGSVYGVSAYVALVGGSLANVTSIVLASRMLGSQAAFPFTPTPTLTRFPFVHTTSGADNTWQPGFTLNYPTTGVAIDLTLRIAAPQWELGSYGVTELILPPAGVPGFASRSVRAMPAVQVRAACTIAGNGAIATAEQVGIVGAKLSTQTAAVWDPASANFPALTLFSNENRTIRFTSNGVDGARGTVLLSGGKLYCEFTPGAVWNQDNSFGLASTSATYNGLYNDGEHGCVLQPAYGVYVHHTWPNILTSTWNALETVALAVDLDNDRAWFRLLPSGLWNGVPGADPTIPSTGIDISIIPSQQLQLVAGLGDLNSGGTLNAGSVPFLASVPAGYSGWPPRGYLQAGPFVREQASAAIGGVSALRANAGPVLPTGAILAGAGTLFADPHPARPAVATLPGVGSFAADAAPRKAAGGLIVGVGQLTTSAWELAQAAATLAATATLAANGIRVAQTYLAGATFAGTGNLVATVTAGGGAAALIAGTGSVLGAGVSRLLTQANLSGISSLVVDGAGWRPGLARMAGLGSLRADAHPARAARSTIPGQGGVTNWIHNPRGANAVVGTFAPGQSTTNPPWWDTDVGNGLTREIVGNFTVDGVDVLRMRFYGVPDLPADPPWAFWLVANAAFEYTPEYTPGVGFLTKMPEGQVYTRSFYLRLAAGSWANTNNLTFWGILVDATGATIQPPVVTVLPSPGSAITRYADTVTATGGTPPYQTIAFGLTIDRVDPPAYIDVTFDIGGGQAELGSTLTALILPPAGQLGTPTTRALQAMPVTLVSAAAHISGDSSVTVGAATQQRAAARIAGEGFLVADGYSPAQQVVSGEGYFVAISSQIIAAAGARLDGVGLVRAAGYSGVSYARARIDGSSDCWAEDYWLTSQPVTRLHGVGQATASTVAHLIAGAAPTAISHLSADAMPTVFVGVRLWPEGNLIARPVAQLGGAAKLGGEGTLSVRGLASLTSARLTGAGRLIASATTVGAVYTAARLAGLGQLRATANAPVHAAARLAGLGQVGADGTVAETSGIHHGAALLAGIGRLVGRVPGRVQAAATIPGVGHLAADTVAHLIAGSAPTAISHLRVDLSQVFPAIMVGARIWPEGKLVAIAGPARAAAAAQLAGVGTLRARADAERILAVTLGGEGSLAADAITVPPAPPVTLEAAALIAGEGAFPADHPWDDALLRDGTGLPPINVLAGAFAQIRGIGHLVAGNSPQTLHAAALIRGDGRLTDFRGGGIYDEAALGGTVNVKRSLAGVMRGTVSLTGRLRAGAVLAGVVQGDQEK